MHTYIKVFKNEKYQSRKYHEFRNVTAQDGSQDVATWKDTKNRNLQLTIRFKWGEHLTRPGRLAHSTC